MSSGSVKSVESRPRIPPSGSASTTKEQQPPGQPHQQPQPPPPAPTAMESLGLTSSQVVSVPVIQPAPVAGLTVNAGPADWMSPASGVTVPPPLLASTQVPHQGIKSFLQSGVTGCEKGVVNCFLKVPLACLGSTAAEVQSNIQTVELSENILQNLFHHLTPQIVNFLSKRSTRKLR